MTFARSSLTLFRTALIGQSLRNGPQVESVRLAGHSHWQNIRHAKEAKDMNKAKVTDRHVRFIETAVQFGGGADPRMNRQLANAIEAAKRTQVVSNAAIETAIKRAAEGTVVKNQKPMVYEFIGEHGALVVAKCDVVNVSKLVHSLKGICKRHAWRMAKGGVKERFTEKGFVYVTGRQDEKVFDQDEALMVAIDGGAEEVSELGEGSSLVHEFICDPARYLALMGTLNKSGYVIHDYGTKWIPMVPIDLDQTNMAKVGAFCDELEEQSEVVSTFTNLS